MSAEEKLDKQFAEYKALAEEDKKVDASVLMINALEQVQREDVDRKKVRRAYIVSVLLPPFGLLYAAYYAFGDKPGGKRVALVCVILTAVVVLLSWLAAKMILSSFSADQMSQLKDGNPKNIQDLKEILQP